MNTTLRTAGRRVVTLAAVLACCSVLVWAATKGPDAGGYGATDDLVYSFVDISGSTGGSTLLSGTDDGTAVLALPFPIRFYGQSYSLACVSTNGAMYFIESVDECSGFDGDFANVDLTAASVPNDRPALLPFWSDLTFQVPGAGGVIYQTLGASPNRRFVLQWDDAFPQGSSSPVTFQIILAESTNAIVFQYQTVELGPGDPSQHGAQATVGIRNASGVSTNQQLQWSYKAPVIRNRTALQFGILDAVPPAVTARATPPLLWPANGKHVRVLVWGRVTDAGSLAGVRYAVTDEYGLVQPSGPITVSEHGWYWVAVTLVADRHGRDRDGRKYTIVVTATDQAGNEGSASTTVLVPHDMQRDDRRDDRRDDHRDDRRQ
jgi:hypothetical protein